jgi:hypothetical protein
MFHKRVYANDRLWLEGSFGTMSCCLAVIRGYDASNCPDLGISLLLYEQWSPGVYSTPPAENSYKCLLCGTLDNISLRQLTHGNMHHIVQCARRAHSALYTYIYTYV